MREWFPKDSPDANLLTLHVKARADGSAEVNYLPTTQRDLSNAARRRVRDWGFDRAEMCLWSDDATTFGKLQACALDPVTAAGYWKYELRFLRSGKTYRVRVWRPSPDSLRSGDKPTELRITADGQARVGDLARQHVDPSAMMESLRRDGKLRFVAVIVDPACPMGFVFDILAAGVDRGVSEVTLMEEYDGKR